jgi:serine/threonine protein kinase
MLKEAEAPVRKSIGGTIGKYEIVGRIGSGGFGTVFEAWDPVIKRRVAIKVCDAGRDIQARFLKEAELAGRLQHPNITTVYDCGMEGETPFMVQELLGGEDLSELMGRGEEIELVEKIKILIGIAVGLEYAHRSGVVHRDIKPANIRILENRMVKIMDFGIARALDAPSSLTGAGVTVGSSCHMAPEQVCGDPVDGRTDMFSFGVLAFELLCSQKPFASENLFQLLEMIVKDDPEVALSRRAPDLPIELVALVERAMRKRPEDRFPSMRELMAALLAAYPGVAMPLDPAEVSTPVSESEARRLKAVGRYAILDTAPEAAFDDLARLASQICATPFAMVSMVGRDRQWSKASVGDLARQSARQEAFCSHTILGRDVLVVPDARVDVRFRENPAVRGEPHLRFYAGAPLLTPDGYAVGTLCVLDREPRELSLEQRQALRVLAAQVVAQLELRRHRSREAESSGEKLLLEVSGLSDPPAVKEPVSNG